MNIRNFTKIIGLATISHMSLNTATATAASASAPASGIEISSATSAQIRHMALSGVIQPTPSTIRYGVDASQLKIIHAAIKKTLSGSTDRFNLVAAGIAYVQGVPAAFGATLDAEEAIDANPLEAKSLLIKALETSGSKTDAAALSASLHLGLMKLSGQFNERTYAERKAISTLFDHARMGYTDHLVVALQILKNDNSSFITIEDMIKAMGRINAVKNSPFAHFYQAEYCKAHGNIIAAIPSYLLAKMFCPTYFEAFLNMGLLVETLEKAGTPLAALSSFSCFESAYHLNQEQGAKHYVQALLTSAKSQLAGTGAKQNFDKAQAILDKHLEIRVEAGEKDMLLTAAMFYAENHEAKPANFDKAIHELNRYLNSAKRRGEINKHAFIDAFNSVNASLDGDIADVRIEQDCYHLKSSLEKHKEALRKISDVYRASFEPVVAAHALATDTESSADLLSSDDEMGGSASSAASSASIAVPAEPSVMATALMSPPAFGSSAIARGVSVEIPKSGAGGGSSLAAASTRAFEPAEFASTNSDGSMDES